MGEDIREIFYSEAHNIISTLREIVGRGLKGVSEKDIDEAYRLIHTLKGAAGFVGLSELIYTCHKWEESLNLIKKTKRYEEFLPTISSAVEEINDILYSASYEDVYFISARDLHEIEGELLGILEDISKGKTSDILKRLRGMYNRIFSLRTRPISDIYKRLRVGFNELLSKTGKKAIIQTLGGNITLEVDNLKRVESILVHLVRNAVDHGIEPPEERIKKGKGEFGIVKVEAQQEGSYLKISVSDDGRGIDLEFLEKKGKEMGLQFSNPLDLIFVKGFSTKEEVTEISGRGYGMDIVLEEAKSLGGWVNVKTEKDRGTTVEVYILSALWGSRYLFGNLKGYNVALNLDYVYRVALVEDGVISRGEEFLINIEGNLIPLVGYDGKADYAVILLRDNKAFALSFVDIYGIGVGSFKPVNFQNDDFVGLVISDEGGVFVMPNIIKWFVGR
ncbi:MAG: ATP-binding protein [candidate division WOR-3 bacterium]